MLQVSKKYVGKDVAKEIRDKAKPFITWLKEAEEDESSDDEGDVQVCVRARVCVCVCVCMSECGCVLGLCKGGVRACVESGWVFGRGQGPECLSGCVRASVGVS